MEGAIRCSANYVPLSPISFLERSAIVYKDRTSIVYGSIVYTWRETLERCTRLASALSQLGISRGDVVATLAPNIPATYEVHFGVPMAGAVLCVLNTHNDSEMISVLIEHSGAKIIFVDYQFVQVAKGAIDILSKTGTKLPILVLIPESDQSSPDFCNHPSETLEYESLLRNGDLDFEILRPKDECEAISLSYTSGTTSIPKGVIYSHRGAYLNSLAQLIHHEMGTTVVYLWSVPMFHCNGWCLTWAVAAQGGMNVCLRDVSAKEIFTSISRHQVTHMGGAPTILNMIVNAPEDDRRRLPGKVVVMTGGAPPPSPILLKIEEQGFSVTHAYGMTETYGPGTVCTWKPEWHSLPKEEQAKLKSRQGLQHIMMQELDVKDPATMKSIPPDAKTMGEVMFRGNTVMNGYFKDTKKTHDAFESGWFRTGDFAVRHPDGYLVVTDRSSDIIISGGRYISTIEVESVLFKHPDILEVAIIGRPDEFLGETPCAFVKLKNGSNPSAEDIIKFCRDRLPQYMAPQTVIFEDLPKTSTGKVQKYVLREKTKVMGSLSSGAMDN
ncbi:butanoate--CoA ligase AAE1-like [Argentina anserina]|uniref:butanoate--CoA ligase AAE1-like n=1 Tax=Argentina anserina TaxID=57926 RepID=UPI00217691A7|nr:butanoate--CoA ligase AAE1-like [Potentilla anserina]